jgi:hypothetical protein
MNTAYSFNNQNLSGEEIPEYKLSKELISSPDSESIEKDWISGPTTEKIQEPKVLFELVDPPPTLKGRFKMLQQWEGYVVEVNDNEFSAIITDKTNLENEDQYAIINSEDISPDDLFLLEPGAVFYWSIGFYDYPGRGRSRESRIRFRRLIGPSKADISRSEKTGKFFADFFRSN